RAPLFEQLDCEGGESVSDPAQLRSASLQHQQELIARSRQRLTSGEEALAKRPAHDRFDSGCRQWQAAAEQHELTVLSQSLLHVLRLLRRSEPREAGQSRARDELRLLASTHI